MGAITEPCGTPLITGAQSEYIPSYTTRCFLSFKNVSIQMFTGPVIPYLSSFWISLWCGTLSNALAKSIMITSVCLLSLRLARISCVKASKCVSVDCFFEIHAACRRGYCWLRGGLVGVLRLCVLLVCCTHT